MEFWWFSVDRLDCESLKAEQETAVWELLGGKDVCSFAYRLQQIPDPPTFFSLSSFPKGRGTKGLWTRLVVDTVY